ncbi:hypothetical protein TSAR_011632 [Trichomalopsis sarcophagae]|uniref:Uncharacterized protein n=1 Tax=Trichomalopsis sarcophagae TaxID=543379 RepID=A0A232FE16_9HYME|nr:hypothetical protein TSAR_011632 [Trichomalopsis sarcophagae]
MIKQFLRIRVWSIAKIENFEFYPYQIARVRCQMRLLSGSYESQFCFHILGKFLQFRLRLALENDTPEACIRFYFL